MIKMKKSTGVAAVALLVVTVVAVGIFSTSTIAIIQLAEAYIDPNSLRTEPKAPMAVSQDGNNVYIVWWTNKSGN
jgi:hypothetical protein